MTKQYTADQILKDVMLPFAERGIPLILAWPGQKNPFVKGWPDKAHTDLDRLRVMAETVADTGNSIFAVSCASRARSIPSPVFVLDPDIGDTKDGVEDLAELEREFGELPTTPTRITPGGGRHLIFAANGLELRGRGQLPKSIDVPAGFCIFRDGTPYEWEDGKSFDDVEPVEPPEWLVEKLTTQGGKRKGAGKPPSLQSAIAQVAYYLSKFDPDRVDNHEDWIHVGMAIHHTFERYKAVGFDLGLAFWDEWSKQSSKYKVGECERRWKTFGDTKDETLGIGSMRQWCSDDMVSRGENFKPPGVHTPAVDSEELMDAMAAMGYQYRLNEMGRLLEASVNQKSFEPMTDDLMATIRLDLRDAGYGKYLSYAEDALWSQARENAYHPIRDWLNSLTWDGEDHITKLASYFTDKHGLFEFTIKRWLVGAVARSTRQSLADPSVQVFMLVLLGRQGIGKSYLAEWLCSPQREYFHEGGINPRDKDDRIRRASMFIWEVPELGAIIRRSELEELKSFMSVKNQRDRHPYGRYDMQSPAMVSFIGTLNEEEFLIDTTGNRRFVVCDISEIEWAYSKDMDVSQVWAQAVELWKAGEEWELTGEEAMQRDMANLEHEVQDPVQANIERCFDFGVEGVKTETTQIVNFLKAIRVNIGNDRMLTQAVGRTMRKLNVKKGKDRSIPGSSPTVYFGVAINKLGQKLLAGSEYDVGAMIARANKENE